MQQSQTDKQKIEKEESLQSSRELLKQFASHLQTLRKEEKVTLSRELNSIHMVGLQERVKVFGENLQFGVDKSCGVRVVLSIPENIMK